MATLRFGFLAQPQFESVGHSTGSGMSNNLFVRRTRLLLLASMYKRIEFFLDTDYPDLFKTGAESADGAKNQPGMFIQDVWGTVDIIDKSLRVDIGYMLPPLSRNAVQGAINLYGWDYFANTFRHSASFNSINAWGLAGNPLGRDVGVQFRGLVLDKHLEYRAGVFQGRREAVIRQGDPAVVTELASRNSFRLAARLQYNFLDPEEFFLYGGTYLGTKKIASLGASIDWQHGPGDTGDYIHVSGDGVVDLDVGPGLLTAQANFQHWNGNWGGNPGQDWIPTLPNQSAIMFEGGFLFWGPRLSPIVRFENRWVRGETDETRVGGGLAYWPYAHAFNLKAFYTQVIPGGAGLESFPQFNVQAQFLLL